MSSDRPWWTPEAHADRRPFLALRAASRRRSAPGSRRRASSRSRPACLQVSPGNEAHLHAFATELIGPDGRRAHALPAHLARVRAARSCWPPASAKIFTLRARVPQPRARARCTRPSSPCSNGTAPASPTRALMADCAAILKLAAETADNRFVSWRGVTANPRAEPERLTVARPSAATPASTCSPACGDGGNDARPARRHGGGAGVAPRADDTWSDIFSRRC